jgi:hypothetical protein
VPVIVPGQKPREGASRKRTRPRPQKPSLAIDVHESIA